MADETTTSAAKPKRIHKTATPAVAAVPNTSADAPLKTHFEEPTANLPYVPAAKVPAGATGIVFHLNDKVIKTRGFSADEHGKDWQESAEEFHKTNEKKVLKREIL